MLKIGILLDTFELPLWQREIIRYVKEHASLSLQLVVVNLKPVVRKPKGREAYKLLRRVDRALFTVRHHAFQVANTETLFVGVDILRIHPSTKKFTTEVGSEDVIQIKNKNLDVLIRFGFGIIKGELLQAARLGIWSLHHGDNAVNRGGPPAFWEIVNREAVTGVTLQQLTEKLDGGIVLGKAFTRTDFTSFHRNQNQVYWSGVELFCSSLDRVAQTGDHAALMNQHIQHVPYTLPLYRDPDNRNAIKIFFLFWWRRLKEFVRGWFKQQQWSLYVQTGNYSTSIPLKSFAVLSPPRGVDWADPFVLKKDDQHYVFFEELPIATRKAHISYIILDKSGKLLSPSPVKILEEAWHLSYPFIFEYQGKYWMLPEAAASNEVWLYECEEFPDQWKRHSVMLKEVGLYDPTVLFHDGTWYLMGTQKPWKGSSADQYLYLYYSEDIFSGDWKPHPQNPVTRDVRGARPAGKIFEHDGKLIRPSQLGAPKYGYGIRFHEIMKLSPTDYEEKRLHDILPDWRKGLVATHTFNAAGGMMVVDGQGI